MYLYFGVFPAYVKRVIVHPQFYNVDYKGCVRLMQDMDQGDVVIRPSSKVRFMCTGFSLCQKLEINEQTLHLVPLRTRVFFLNQNFIVLTLF